MRATAMCPASFRMMPMNAKGIKIRKTLVANGLGRIVLGNVQAEKLGALVTRNCLKFQVKDSRGLRPPSCCEAENF
jgi:hypothetical protein